MSEACESSEFDSSSCLLALTLVLDNFSSFFINVYIFIKSYRRHVISSPDHNDHKE